jgi:hypothetical protein
VQEHARTEMNVSAVSRQLRHEISVDLWSLLARLLEDFGWFLEGFSWLLEASVGCWRRPVGLPLVAVGKQTVHRAGWH